MVAIIIISIILLIIFAFIWLKHHIFISNILWHFKHTNVIVSGKKGSGKDLTFNYVIKKRKKFYYSNISYGGNHKVISLKDVSCYPNDYEHITNDNITKTPHKFKENCDIYISDIGIFLPSYMDSKLYSKFPSMPILYALSRHLYSNNIHCNTQNLERAWKALREQADFYIIAKRTYHILGFLFTRVYTYDNYESARKGLKPIKTRRLNKYSRAEVDLYNAQNGEIKKGFIINRVSKIDYNSRAFEKILLKGKRKY